MRGTAILATAMLCAACAPAAAPTAGVPPATAPVCQTATVPVEVGGKPVQATVEACPLPDGSWRITQTTPGLPPQVYVMPPPPAGAYPAAAADYFDYWPYWGGGGWWFWGIGPTIVIVRNIHHPHEAHPGGHPMPPRAIAHGVGHAVAAAPGGAGMHR
jgi:hypothetical protein